MTTEELRESLLSAPKNGYSKLTEEQRKEMESYALRYRAFMDACKTEREATAWATAMAEKHGFVPAVPGMEVKPGDKIYMNNRGKSPCTRIPRLPSSRPTAPAASRSISGPVCPWPSTALSARKTAAPSP